MLPRPSEHGEATLYHKRDLRLLSLSSHLRTVLENEELAMTWDHVGCVHIWSSAFNELEIVQRSENESSILRELLIPATRLLNAIGYVRAHVAIAPRGASLLQCHYCYFQRVRALNLQSQANDNSFSLSVGRE
jgi:hypothetical protein